MYPALALWLDLRMQLLQKLVYNAQTLVEFLTVEYDKGGSGMEVTKAVDFRSL